MLRWFRAVLPREKRFFDLFARHAQTALQGALALQGMLNGGEDVPLFCQRVSQLEQEADDITREVLTAVRRIVVTPFDRGDIRNLITAMDNAIDQMEKTAKAAMLFDIRTFTPEMRQMGDAVVRCALLVDEAIPLLHAISQEAGHINALTEQIQLIEGKADDLHDAGVMALFEQRNADPMGFITANEVYAHLEKTVDRF